MLGKLVSVLLLVGVVSAKIFEGVDPNTLSCDPKGQIFLLLPDFEDCTKYYICVHGQEVRTEGCPAPLLFDFELQGCNWNWATECVVRKRPGADSGESESEELEGSGSGDNEVWLPEHSEELKDVDDLEDKPHSPHMQTAHFAAALDCSRADSAARQVPYKGDCQRFWRCVSGLPQTFYCSDGLFFNEASQSCDFEANVKCSVEFEDELQQEFLQVL